MKLFAIIQLFILFVGSLVLAEARGNMGAASFAIGAGLILLNIVTLGISWTWIIHKKLVALPATVIVFKYAIFGVIIYKLLSFPWVDVFWFSMGLASLILTTLIYAFFIKD